MRLVVPVRLLCCGRLSQNAAAAADTPQEATIPVSNEEEGSAEPAHQTTCPRLPRSFRSASSLMSSTCFAPKRVGPLVQLYMDRIRAANLAHRTLAHALVRLLTLCSNLGLAGGAALRLLAQFRLLCGHGLGLHVRHHDPDLPHAMHPSLVI